MSSVLDRMNARRAGRARFVRARILRALVVLVAALSAGSPLAAQRNNNNRNPGGFGGGGFGGGGGGGGPSLSSVRWGLPDVRSGFYICRLGYPPTQGFGDGSGSGWHIEYPRADINFLTRITQLTTTKISYWKDGRSTGKGHTVVLATDPELFSCPYVVAASPGSIAFTDADVKALREYLLKGGFLWVDDFWGPQPWSSWVNQISRVLPEYPIQEMTAKHALFSVLYQIPELPQIPSLNRWQPGMSTAEIPGAVQDMHGIFAEDGRLMVLMTHNTDINDGFEREADLPSYFESFAARAYALGINVVIWVMTR